MNQEHWQQENKTLPIDNTPQNNKICWICGFIAKKHLKTHIHYKHKISKKDYYDKFYKHNGEGVCLQCGKPTNFVDSNHYLKFCSTKCSTNNAAVLDKYKATVLKRYGVENVSQSKEIKNKKIQTCLRNFGVEWPMQSESIMDKSKATLMDKFGVPHIMMCEEGRELYRKGINDKYGCNCVFQSEAIKSKIRKTNIRKYGVPAPSQNKEIYKKQQISMKKFKEYVLPSGKIIKIKGYEPQFLDHIFTNNLLTENEIQYEALSIDYAFNNRTRKYYPDFFIPKYNLVVEIKSSYVLNELDLKGEQEQKTKACLQQGYKFLLVVDNNFKPLAELLDTFQAPSSL